MPLERTLERKFYGDLAKWASKQCIRVEIVKLSLVGRRGWPDRMIIWYGENTLFIEFKRPGESPTKMQNYVHTQLRNMGFTVLVHDNVTEALKDVQAHIIASTLTD